MKLAIFGGTGRTGMYVIEKALAQGNTITVLARLPEKLGRFREKVTVIQGAISDRDKVLETVNETDVVISTLGPSKAKNESVMSCAAMAITEAMKAKNVRRILWMTGAGVSDPRDKPSFTRPIIIGIMKLIASRVLNDSIAACRTICTSNLDWTVIRAPMLNDEVAKGGYRANYFPPKPKPVSRRDIAGYIIDHLSDSTLIGEAPMISY